MPTVKSKKYPPPTTVGELENILLKLAIDIPFGFRNQPAQELWLTKHEDGQVFLSFCEAEDSQRELAAINQAKQELDNLMKYAKAMRQAQITYFRNRNNDNFDRLKLLEDSKKAEKQFDAYIEALAKPLINQSQLF
jgi:hypothetical protein